MIEYIVQQKDYSNYLVHKFEGISYYKPSQTYSISDRGKLKCNCPSGSYRGYCKHVEMVSLFKKAIAKDKEVMFYIEVKE